jgi:TRAP-type uncharacterized transport system substrate-binding protein
MSKLFSISAILAATAFAGTTAFAQANLTAETASPGGPTHLAPSHLVEIAGTKGIANIQLADGQTLTNSLQNVAEGKTDIASTPHILPFLMNRGVGPYGELGADKGAELAGNLRAIYPFVLGNFMLFAFDAKGITGWDGLKGKKIFNGPPRGGALTNARAMIQLTAGLKEGDDYEGIQSNWGQATATISGGSVDAVVLPEVFPSGRTSTLSAAGKMTAWSMPKEVYDSEAMQKYIRAPGSAPLLLPVSEVQAGLGEQWTIVSEDDMFRGFSTVGGDVVHKDMDEELVYKLVSAYIASLDALKAKAPYGNTVGYDNPGLGMCGANPVKYHKGATRAWEEAGYEIPDCAKDNG